MSEPNFFYLLDGRSESNIEFTCNYITILPKNTRKHTVSQGYLVLGFLSILDEKSRFGDRSYSGKS